MYRYQFVSDQKDKKKTKYAIKTRVWLYPGMAGWHFVTIPVGTSKIIKRKFGLYARGWGSLPVIAKVGKSEWKTSIFPDKKVGTYLLPLKTEIRRKEAICKGDLVRLCIRIL